MPREGRGESGQCGTGAERVRYEGRAGAGRVLCEVQTCVGGVDLVCATSAELVRRDFREAAHVSWARRVKLSAPPASSRVRPSTVRRPSAAPQRDAQCEERSALFVEVERELSCLHMFHLYAILLAHHTVMTSEYSYSMRCKHTF